MFMRRSRPAAVQVQKPLLVGMVAPVVECVHENEVLSERTMLVE